VIRDALTVLALVGWLVGGVYLINRYRREPLPPEPVPMTAAQIADLRDLVKELNKAVADLELRVAKLEEKR
jgi:hypothetical protein